MKKHRLNDFVLLFSIITIFCITLTSCGVPSSPGENELRPIVESESNNQSYSIDSFELLNEQTTEDGKTAHKSYKVSYISDDQMSKKYETWDFYCQYERGSGWSVLDYSNESTEYELLADLSEAQCASLLSDYAPSDYTLKSLRTDKEGLSATAEITYQTSLDNFYQFDTEILKADAIAEFSWSPSNQWTISDYTLSKDSSYIYSGSTHFDYTPGYSWTNSDRSISFDISIDNNVVTMSDGVVGKDNRPIHFSNARITELYDFVVTVEFDYECDVLGNSKITNSTGKIDFYGSIRTANKNTTHLSLEDWDYNDWWDSFSTWNKYFDAMPK